MKIGRKRRKGGRACFSSTSIGSGRVVGFFVQSASHSENPFSALSVADAPPAQNTNQTGYTVQSCIPQTR